jgi:2-octaprenyl-6-methoxyphenol hydroxylase
MSDNSEVKTYDVLIVGGGMVGASLACALGDSGMHIAVIEAFQFQSDQQPSYDVRTISLSHGSRKIMQSLEIWPLIDPQAVCPIRRIHVSDRGHPGLAHLDGADAGVDALGYVIENRALGQALMQRIDTFDNIDMICPASVSDIRFDANAASLVCDTEKGERLLHGRLVVVADGGRSGLRESLGMRARTDDYEQTAIVCNVTPGLDHQHCAYERFTESGPLALLPMNDRRCWCVWSAHPDEVDELLALSDEDFLARLQRRFGDRLGRFSRVGERYVYPLARNRVDMHYRERVVLIGNAAHTVHPVAAQGFNLGLRDVAWLAETLRSAETDGRDPGSLEVLQQYASQREQDNKRVTGFTHAMIRVFTSRLAPMIAGRNLGLLLVDLVPELKTALLKRTMGVSGRQSRLARGLSNER